jgi:DNA excision repair protein ERCC-4
VYDISDVPTDGSPLTLLGEKVVNGYYNSARSVDNTAIVMMTSYVDTSQITNDIYRWNPQYCGLNSTEYEELAVTTVLNKTGSFNSFVDQMMEELKLNNGSTCDNIFQVSYLMRWY